MTKEHHFKDYDDEEHPYERCVKYGKEVSMTNPELVKAIIKVLEELATKQRHSVIKAVDKKGLMNTGWDDIDKEGGHLDFEVIANAIASRLTLNECKALNIAANTMGKISRDMCMADAEIIALKLKQIVQALSAHAGEIIKIK